MDSSELKFERLRQLAEELIKQNGSVSDSSETEVNRLLHELRVHQIELNLQNEELRRTQESLEIAKQKYTDLFDYAPLAYFVINEDDVIIEANLTAVAKFGTTRQAFRGRPFSNLVAFDDRDKYYKYHHALVEERLPLTTEVWFANEGNDVFYGRIDSILFDEFDDSTSFRIAVTDITERKVYEDRLEAIVRLDETILTRPPIVSVIEQVLDELWKAFHSESIAVILFDYDDKRARFYIREDKSDVIRRSGQTSQRLTDFDLFEDVLTWQGDGVRIIDRPVFLPLDIVIQYPAHLAIPIYQGR